MKKIITIISISAFIVVQSFAQKTINPSNAIQSQITSISKTQLEPIIEEPTVQPARKCATPVLNETFENWISDVIEKRQQFANGRTATTVYTIPIIFHIIHTGQAVGSGRNISLARINSQITRLNEDYRKLNADRTTYLTQASFTAIHADCEINFCAAKTNPSGAVLPEPGIERILASSKGWTNPPYSGFSPSYLEGTVKPQSIWDPTKYFNVWIAEFNDGVLGYAQFPTVPSGTTPITDIVGMGGSANTDGVVLDYKYTGDIASSAPYDKGRTLTHEVGHWLGLRHINGDASCGNDYVTDTPQQSNLSGACPATAGTVVTSGCAASPNPPGRLYQNYMDYSDDKCMVMFSTGQKARIQAVMANCSRRTSLATSTVCSIPAGINESSSILELNLFPNPSNGEVNIAVNLLNTEDFTVSVINTLGQTIKEVKKYNSNGATVTIDLSEHAKGVYFVMLKTKTGIQTKRLTLQ